MAQSAHEYNGPGFSPMGDKSRFVLPAKFRKTLKESNSGDRVLYLDKHPAFPCLIGFGEPYKRMLSDEIRADAPQAQDRYLLHMQLYSFIDVPFDESGRFIMPRPMMELAGIASSVYFHGTGPYFTIWDPEQLLAMAGPAFMAAQIHCRAQMGTAKGRG